MAIYANMMGRLGNQMFIYAFAESLRYSRGRDETVFINNPDQNRLFNLNISHVLEPYTKIPVSSFRKYLSIYIYGKKAMRFTPSELFEYENKKAAELSGMGLYYCRNGYIDFSSSKSKDVSIIGFFQSEKYFKEIKDSIISQFTPKSKIGIPHETENILRVNPNAVCISIRLGDYLNNPVHGVCTVDYYVNAMNIMKRRLGTPLFYVSTEDPEKIRNMPEFSGYNMIFEDSSLQDYQKLYLTNQCSHFILSNSTFSWWGYYLSRNRILNGGVTIAPSRWFNTDIPCDIYMDDWTVINP